MEKKEQLVITPKTKVHDLLENYPQLEKVLISLAPAFKKLRNPVLRRTVARIATLQQAASIGNLKVEELINTLRKEVGQDLLSVESTTQYNTENPAWFSQDLIKGELDIREMLANEEQPVNQLMADLNELKPGKIFKVKAPFLPAPLIDKASSLDLEHWVHKLGEDEFEVFFYKST